MSNSFLFLHFEIKEQIHLPLFGVQNDKISIQLQAMMQTKNPDDNPANASNTTVSRFPRQSQPVPYLSLGKLVGVAAAVAANSVGGSLVDNGLLRLEAGLALHLLVVRGRGAGGGVGHTRIVSARR